MTDDHQTIAEMFPNAEHTMELTQESHDWRSYLALHKGESMPDKPYTVMGDLLGAWGIEDAFATIEGDGALFGHYIVERDLKAQLPENLLSKVELDSEGMTFFAYTETLELGKALMEAIHIVVEHRDAEQDAINQTYAHPNDG